jgi:hypothetical protein
MKRKEKFRMTSRFLSRVTPQEEEVEASLGGGGSYFRPKDQRRKERDLLFSSSIGSQRQYRESKTCNFNIDQIGLLCAP